VPVGRGVFVAVGVPVGIGVGVAVGDPVCVDVGVFVGSGVSVAVDVAVGVSVSVDVAVAAGDGRQPENGASNVAPEPVSDAPINDPFTCPLVNEISAEGASTVPSTFTPPMLSWLACEKL
jgi:hypothetical protein